MIVTIKFSDIPDDLIFEIKSRTEYANAVYEAWQYVRDDVESLKCFVECPDNLPQEWAIVPELSVPKYWGNLVVLYRQWPSIQECYQRLNDLSEIVDESRQINGIVEAPEELDEVREAVVMPFMVKIK